MLRENFPLDSPDHNAYNNKAVGLHVNCFIFIFAYFLPHYIVATHFRGYARFTKRPTTVSCWVIRSNGR